MLNEEDNDNDSHADVFSIVWIATRLKSQKIHPAFKKNHNNPRVLTKDVFIVSRQTYRFKVKFH